MALTANRPLFAGPTPEGLADFPGRESPKHQPPFMGQLAELMALEFERDRQPAMLLNTFYWEGREEQWAQVSSWLRSDSLLIAAHGVARADPQD